MGHLCIYDYIAVSTMTYSPRQLGPTERHVLVQAAVTTQPSCGIPPVNSPKRKGMLRYPAVLGGTVLRRSNAPLTRTLLRSMTCSPRSSWLSPAKVIFVRYRPRPRAVTTADWCLGRPRRCRYSPESQTSESATATSRKSWRRLITHWPGSGAGSRSRPSGASVQFPCTALFAQATLEWSGETTALGLHTNQTAPTSSQSKPASCAGTTPISHGHRGCAPL